MICEIWKRNRTLSNICFTPLSMVLSWAIHSYKYLELLAHTTVSGVMSYKKVEIQLGATVNGMARHV
jgi:hypothetical protein